MTARQFVDEDKVGEALGFAEPRVGGAAQRLRNRARRDDDAELVVRTDAAIGCLIVDWGKKGLQGKAAQLISLTRKRGLDVPVILLVLLAFQLCLAVLDSQARGPAADQRSEATCSAAVSPAGVAGNSGCCVDGAAAGSAAALGGGGGPRAARAHGGGPGGAAHP